MSCRSDVPTCQDLQNVTGGKKIIKYGHPTTPLPNLVKPLIINNKSRQPTHSGHDVTERKRVPETTFWLLLIWTKYKQRLHLQKMIGKTHQIAVFSRIANLLNFVFTNAEFANQLTLNQKYT
jgi:hypothetical protein